MELQALCGLLFPLQDGATSSTAACTSGVSPPTADALQVLFLRSGYISPLLRAVNVAYEDSTRLGGELKGTPCIETPWHACSRLTGQHEVWKSLPKH